MQLLKRHRDVHFRDVAADVAPISVAVVVLYGIITGAIVNADGSKGDATEHASVRAYPNAIVSATDSDSGITVSVDRDGMSVTARSATGTVLWHGDVLKKTGRPSVGCPVVRYIKITAHGGVLLVIGKHRFIEADLRAERSSCWVKIEDLANLRTRFGP